VNEAMRKSWKGLIAIATVAISLFLFLNWAFTRPSDGTLTQGDQDFIECSNTYVSLPANKLFRVLKVENELVPGLWEIKVGQGIGERAVAVVRAAVCNERIAVGDRVRLRTISMEVNPDDPEIQYFFFATKVSGTAP